ncbi:hypothetical protein FJV41_13800 [Myxococcus llanfairpwllgwyngyllgogerychwyrndrobwllllantysiliogogogochensis]|uniref:Uncharacterized protein n=1 Tax=Myxococcus llanfairpwllgwyngyllgogerychwyrndrobwllllantysiliogogogochensis TaxID=2590453 RepID=A0A540X2F4_9BACT|nr:hypothetical protein [Myxococcus llanfairpwllgwyngyllgogerychwyrndrobwllllantysiliogogogochensis]TQF15406.1 hypothetical protein FJV41_13800 [Myxococcus llanfairpwllgwyngyllgogerychwyrndrobwllllantysiliogogogochensis]
MSYDDVQFIGYHHQLGYNAKNPGAPGRIWNGTHKLFPGPPHRVVAGKGTQAYKGHANDRTDLTNRCSYVKNAILAAANSPHTDMDATTLKVFVMPEFFFRGVRGGYPLELIADVLKDFRKWSFNARPDRFRNWLFVLGTIIGYMDVMDPVVPNRKTGVEVFNIALIQQGGFLSPDGKHERLVYKEYVSGIDYINETTTTFDAAWARIGHVDTRGMSLLGSVNKYRATVPTLGSHDALSQAPTRSQNRDEWSTNSLQGGCIFRLGDAHEDINEVCIGVEVCLDHLQRRMKNSPEGIDTIEPMIQVIPSAGMDIKDPAVRVVNTGYVFNVDGLRTQASAPPAIELKQWNGAATVALETPGTFNIIPVPNPVRVGGALVATDYFASAGEVKIYDTRVMPPRVPVGNFLANLFGEL